MQLASFLLLVVQLAVHVLGRSPLPWGTLVVYDSKFTELENYSKLFEYLKKDQLMELEIKEVGDVSGSLFRNGVRVYQNVIILPTKVRTLFDDVTSSSLLEFVNEGGDVLAVTSPEGLSESVRGFINQLGIYPSPRNHQLIDYFQNENSDNKLIKINQDGLIENAIVNQLPSDFTYSGSSSLITNNVHLIPILQAPTTSFTKNLKNEESTEESWTVGKQGYLAVAHQSLNNARSLWLGDSSILEDSKFEQNSKLIKDLIDWTFQIKNVIKIQEVKHSHVDGTGYEERPYKIKDEIVYSISVSQWDGEKWSPFNTNDIQVDIKLLDPYHRLTLEQKEIKSDSTIYGVQFKLPDHHGVFSFHTDYKRSGYSYIDDKKILSIRHLANDEYERSWDITNSWVYLSSIFAVLISWIIFTTGFIFTKDKVTVTDKKDK